MEIAVHFVMVAGFTALWHILFGFNWRQSLFLGWLIAGLFSMLFTLALDLMAIKRRFEGDQQQ